MATVARPKPSPKSLSVKMTCGCTHVITNTLNLTRRKLCPQHRAEKHLRESYDADTLDGTSYRPPTQEHP